MDSQLFRKETMPSFRPRIDNGLLKTSVNNLENLSKATEPVADPRYPNYASIMEDGRLVTDYKSHCANNVAPSKYGNSLRGFLQHNADAIVQVSRARQAERAGAFFYKAPTVEAARIYQKCDEYECSFTKSDYPDSIGIARAEPVPSLFGTFADPSKMAPISVKPALTSVFEGGRNSPRGRDFVPLGQQPFNPQLSRYGSSG